MAISYKLMKNYNPSSAYYNKYYAKAVHTETTGLEALADRIQRNCTAKRSDVVAVLTELIEVMKDELAASHIVRLDGLGSFKAAFKSKYADTEEAFNVNQCIYNFKVNFQQEYNNVKSGTWIDDEGVSHIKRTHVGKLSSGFTVKKLAQ